MIAVLKENKKIYFAITYGFTFLDGTDESYIFIPENLLFWKIKGASNAMMAASQGNRERDLLLYENLFRGKLTLEKAYEKIIPKMRSIFKKYGLLKSDEQFDATYFIAKNDQVMKITPEGKCTWVEQLDASRSKNLLFASAALKAHMHPIPRLAMAIKTVMDYYAYACFPMAIMEVKTQKITYIKSKEDIWALDSSLKKDW
jgi:hypothetical protein